MKNRDKRGARGERSETWAESQSLTGDRQKREGGLCQDTDVWRRGRTPKPDILFSSAVPVCTSLSVTLPSQPVSTPIAPPLYMYEFHLYIPQPSPSSDFSSVVEFLFNAPPPSDVNLRDLFFVWGLTPSDLCFFVEIAVWPSGLYRLVKRHYSCTLQRVHYAERKFGRCFGKCRTGGMHYVMQKIKPAAG